MKAVIFVKLNAGDFLSALLTIAYLLVGVGTGMMIQQAYHELPLAILGGFFWPLGLAGMLLDHTLCHTLFMTTFGFLLK